ncbi:MAG: hypothetical protein P4L45_15790 [Ignavibacteriaceae bacterium]|nr:hypothetical protein [Ignavibacteriaceae bacterium]
MFAIKLFALVAAIIVLASYLVFKLKDRRRKKPYTNFTVPQLVIEPSVPEVQYLPEPVNNALMVNAPVENIQYDNTMYEAPYYENTQYVAAQPVAVAYQNNQPRSFGQRFKIINEDNHPVVSRGHIIEKLQPVTVAPQRFNARAQSPVFNIYDYYSSNNFEPMHKVSL